MRLSVLAAATAAIAVAKRSCGLNGKGTYDVLTRMCRIGQRNEGDGGSHISVRKKARLHTHIYIITRTSRHVRVNATETVPWSMTVRRAEELEVEVQERRPSVGWKKTCLVVLVCVYVCVGGGD